MRGTVLTIIFCFAFAVSIYGQNKTVLKTDLYGYWTLDLDEYELDENVYIFKKQKEVNNKRGGTKINIFLLDSGLCGVYYDTSSYYCGSGSSTYYSWTLSEDLKRINIYSHSELLKEIKEENPEEFKRMELPNRYDEMELLLIIQDNGDLGLKIIDWN